MKSRYSKSSIATVLGSSLLGLVKKNTGYSEVGSFTHDGHRYDIKQAFQLIKGKKVRPFRIVDLKWVLKHDKPNRFRLANANPNVPIMVAKDSIGRLTVIDGLHRLAKAMQLGLTNIDGYF